METPPAVRTVTPRVSRRAWADPAVRTWWLLAVAVALAVAAYAASQGVERATEIRLIRDGVPVQATVMGNSQKATPGMAIVADQEDVTVEFPWKGSPARPLGHLTRNATIGEVVSLHVDPADVTQLDGPDRADAAADAAVRRRGDPAGRAGAVRRRVGHPPAGAQDVRGRHAGRGDGRRPGAVAGRADELRRPVQRQRLGRPDDPHRVRAAAGRAAAADQGRWGRRDRPAPAGGGRSRRLGSNEVRGQRSEVRGQRSELSDALASTAGQVRLERRYCQPADSDL